MSVIGLCVVASVAADVRGAVVGYVVGYYVGICEVAGVAIMVVVVGCCYIVVDCGVGLCCCCG